MTLWVEPPSELTSPWVEVQPGCDVFGSGANTANTVYSSEGDSPRLDLYMKGQNGLANVWLVIHACYAEDALCIPTMQRINGATYYILYHYANY